MAEKKETKAKKEEKKVEKKAVAPAKKEESKAAAEGSPIADTHKEEGKKKSKRTVEEIEAEMQGLNVIKYPLITEKAVNMIETQNKLVFVIDGNADKIMVKKAVENLYKVKVSKVNILKDMKSRKRAIVTINKKFRADDIATKLGVI
ncbi:50S ribosomal protein L23 [archaeon]|nr:50S ribosomal protein L23 [archaeon]